MILHANSIYCDVFVQFDNVFHSRKVCFISAGYALCREGAAELKKCMEERRRRRDEGGSWGSD